MHVLLIQNCATESFGRYESWLAASEHSYQTAHPYRSDPLPDLERVDAIVVGGTPICALDARGHEFLETEWRYLSRALDRNKPYLGICFGGQLLALLVGGQVRRSGRIEIGGYDVELTPAGKTDPLFQAFPDRFPVFHWHSDTFEPPDAAQLLAHASDCTPQAFRAGNSVGLQFHLEVAAPEAAQWALLYEGELSGLNKRRDDVVEECRTRDARMNQLAGTLIGNFLSPV
jgi:GMP synthase-like glutamine amidotransferase